MLEADKCMDLSRENGKYIFGIEKCKQKYEGDSNTEINN